MAGRQKDGTGGESNLNGIVLIVVLLVLIGMGALQGDMLGNPTVRYVTVAWPVQRVANGARGCQNYVGRPGDHAHLRRRSSQLPKASSVCPLVSPGCCLRARPRVHPG